MFLAHSKSLSPNSYHVLDQFDNRKVLVNADGFKLVSNVCPHQRSLISSKSGFGNRVCPYHSWAFDINGKPLTSGRTEHYCKNNKPLETDQVFEWNSLLFNTSVDFDITESFENLTLMESRVDLVKADYRNVMDLFLDVDHIQSVHRGVYDLVGITDTSVNWAFYNNGSVQQVEQGAIWIAVYPYTMIEWQHGSLFITVARPDGNHTKVNVFKFADSTKDDFDLNQQVWETAWAQDKHQAEQLTEFVDTNLEPQKLHFRKFLELNGLN